jgi:hypothetical protein
MTMQNPLPNQFKTLFPGIIPKGIVPPAPKAPTTAFLIQLVNWQKKSRLHGSYIETTGKKATDIEAMIKSLSATGTAPGTSFLGRLGGYARTSVLDPTNVKLIEEIANYTNQLKIANIEMLKDVFYQDLYSVIPSLVVSGAVNSVDEALNSIAIPPGILPAEIELAKNEISQLLQTRDRAFTPLTELPEVSGEEPLYPELVAPSSAGAGTPVTIHQLSTQEIMKSLRTPITPESAMTEAEFNAYLKEKGYSQEDIDGQTQITTEKLIAEAQNRKNLVEGYIKSVAEMPTLTTMDVLKQVILQPPMVVLEGMNYYYEHVSMPNAGFVYGKIPDIQKAYQEFKRTNPDASDREARTYAWKQWEAPGPPVLDFILKSMIMEGIVDPTMYLGWGIGTKLLRSLGPVGRTLARGNMAIGEVLEAPFDFAKWVTGSVIPKTLIQRATVTSRESLAVIDRYFELATGKPLSFILPKDMYNAAKVALAHLAKNPRAEDDVAMAARTMLIHSPVTKDTVVKCITRLKAVGASTIDSSHLLDDTLLDIDTIFERVIGKDMTADEAAPLLLNKLGAIYGVAATGDVEKLASRILSDMATAIESRALDFTLQTTSNNAMRAFGRKVLKVAMSIEESEVARAVTKSSRFAALLYNVDKKLINPWLTQVNQMVIRPAAESYLTFGMYGPMNMIEDFWRSVLGGVKPGRASVERYDMVTMGLLGDPELRRGGISEMIGPLRETGNPARANWILTMATLPLSVPTYLATRGKVTPTKFSKGAFKTLVELSGAIGQETRRNFVLGKYAQILADTGGEAYKALAEVGAKDLPSVLDSAPKWVKRILKNDVYDAKVSGKLTTDNTAFVQALKDKYTTARINHAEVNDIIMKYPDVSPTSRSLIMDGFNSKTLLKSPDSIDEYMRKTVWDAEIDDFLRGPERAGAEFDQLTELLTSIGTANPEDMANLIVSLHRMTATYGALPNQIMARAVMKSRGLPLADRALQFDLEFDRIYTFLDKAGADIDKVVDFIKAQPHTTRMYKTVAQQYFDITTTVRKVVSDARTRDMAYRSELFGAVKQGDLKSPAFWDDFYAHESGYWSDVNKQMATLNSKLISAVQDMNWAAGTKITPRPSVVVRDRPLAPADVAQLMGVRGDDVSKMLLDCLIPEGDRDYFIEYIMGTVRQGYDVGFDRESVGAVYDQICDSILVDPKSASWLRTRQKELRAMTQDFHDLYNAKLLPKEQKVAIDKYIDETAEAADKLMYKSAENVPKISKITQEQFDKDWSWGAEPIAAIPGEPIEFYKADVNLENAEAWLLENDSGLFYIQRADGALIRNPKTNLPLFESVEKAKNELLKQLRKEAADKVAAPAGRVLKSEFKNYDQLRQGALDEANKWYYKEYVDYTNANVIDAMFKQLYPFWTYESQRLMWLPRSFIRHPGTLTSWGRWQNNTESGYVHIPGTSIDVNPLRGTVYGPWSTRLMRRDYPEYYDNLEGAGGMVGFFDAISRYGFYPNIIYGGTLALVGGAEPQVGGTLPSIFSTPLDALIAAFPNNSAVNFISEKIFPDMFRSYMAARVVDDLGGDGSVIFAKIKNKVALTPEEEDMWTTARRSVGAYSALFEQTGMMRMRSDQSYEVAKQSAIVIEEMTGYTPEQQKEIRDRGEKIWDLIGGLDPWQTATLQELDFFKYSGSVNPLLPSQQQAILTKIELDWTDVRKYSDTLQLEVLDLQTDFLVGSDRGRLGPDAFLSRVRAVYDKRRQYIDNKVAANPLMLLENRAEYFQKYNQALPVQSPYNELMNMYFNVELKDTVDPGTGERIYDWDSFWANREMIADSIPLEDKGQWDAYIIRNTVPIMEVWHDVYTKYFRKYYGVWDATLKLYPDNEQQLINEYLYLEKNGQQLDRQATIQEMVSAKTGRQLISSFRTDVSDSRAALRYANPHLDAWLFYWSKTTSFKTPQAEATYNMISKRTGRDVS